MKYKIWHYLLKKTVDLLYFVERKRRSLAECSCCSFPFYEIGC